MGRGARQAGPWGTALHRAVDKGHLEVTRLLLDAPGASDALRTLDEDGRTPLALAVARGFSDVAVLLESVDDT